MNNLLHIAIESIVRIFPLSESELMMEISSFHPSEHETVP